jgi:hypothetical protein
MRRREASVEVHARVVLRVPTRPLLGSSLSAARARRIVQFVPKVQQLRASA